MKAVANSLATFERDPAGYFDAIFELEDRHGKPIEIHLHEFEVLSICLRAVGACGSIREGT